jgi:conjugal transfer mating pair stabilization protein TraG
MRVSEQDLTEASRQADAARSEAVSATQDRSAVLTEAFTRGLTKLRSARSSSGSSSSSFEQLGETMNRLDQVTRSVADSTGLSQSQVASIAFGASAHLGLSSPVAGASIQGNAGKSYQSGLSEEQRKVLGTMTNEQIAEFKQFGDRVSRDASFITAVADDSREARELASRLSTTTSRAQRAEASFAERNTLAERLSSAREQGETISIDLAQDPHNLEMFMRYAERYGRSSAAAFAMLDSELARQGLRPNRVLSDRSSSPVNPDLTSSDRDNSRQVSRFGRSTPKIEEAPQPSAIRSEVEKKGAAIRQSTESSQGGFDANAQIVRSPDGTLATKKSLLMQSGRQVASDTTESIDAAKGVAKDLLKRKK